MCSCSPSLSVLVNWSGMIRPALFHEQSKRHASKFEYYFWPFHLNAPPNISVRGIARVLSALTGSGWHAFEMIGSFREWGHAASCSCNQILTVCLLLFIPDFCRSSQNMFLRASRQLTHCWLSSRLHARPLPVAAEEAAEPTWLWSSHNYLARMKTDVKMGKNVTIYL